MVAFTISYLAFVLFYLWLCYQCTQPRWFVVLSITGLLAMYFAHMATIVVFQNVSIAFANNDSEIDAIIASDNAQLVAHAIFFAPSTSVAVTLLGCVVYAVRRNLQSRARTVSVDGKASSHRQDANPYRPPTSVGKSKHPQ